jgi:hypothetical protein
VALARTAELRRTEHCQMQRFPNENRARRHGVVVLIAKIPSAVPLLDTLKVLHIWYTTITTPGWYLLEFNYSGLVIGAMKTELNVCAARFRRSNNANLCVASAPTGELKHD